MQAVLHQGDQEIVDAIGVLMGYAEYQGKVGIGTPICRKHTFRFAAKNGAKVPAMVVWAGGQHFQVKSRNFATEFAQTFMSGA